MTVTLEDLERWHQDKVARRRAFLRKRYAYLTSAIRDAEAAGAEGAPVLHELKILLGFVIRDANLLDRDETIRAMQPKAVVGERFTAGRKAGTVSPLRLAVRRILTRRPKATTAEVWGALKARPPRGITFVDSPRLGRYVETEGRPDTSYRSLANIVAKERPK
jgi:hypothetical protein